MSVGMVILEIMLGLMFVAAGGAKLAGTGRPGRERRLLLLVDRLYYEKRKSR